MARSAAAKRRTDPGAVGDPPLRVVEHERPPPAIVSLVASREEIAAVGYDDFAQGFSLAPACTGIRIPLQALAVPYRVLCARVDLDDGDAIVGLRQGIEIGAIAGASEEGFPTAPMYPLVRPVVTYNWSFVDATWRWTLTREPMPAPGNVRAGALDQDTFVFEDSSSPALVYSTATIPPPASAALPTYTGLTAYTPPAMRGARKLVLRDIRWPVDGPVSEENVFFRVERPERWRLYCDVMQTNPATRNAPTLGSNTNTLAAGLPPEELFLQFCQNISSSLAVLPVVWRVHGRIAFERARRECR